MIKNYYDVLLGMCQSVWRLCEVLIDLEQFDVVFV